MNSTVPFVKQFSVSFIAAQNVAPATPLERGAKMARHFCALACFVTRRFVELNTFEVLFKFVLTKRNKMGHGEVRRHKRPVDARLILVVR